MTTASQRKPAAGSKTPASLLSVPIFKQRKPSGPPGKAAEAARGAQDPELLPAGTAPETAAEALSPVAAPGPEPTPASAPEPDPTPEAAAAPKPEPAPAPEAPRYRNLRHYWRKLGHGAAPAIEDLDGDLIGAAWPYTLLIRVPEDGPLDIVRVFAPAPESGAANGASHPLAGDQYSQLSSWVLQLARDAAGGRGPLETRESFQLGSGPKRFAAQALPCESRADAAGYVLLNIGEG